MKRNFLTALALSAAMVGGMAANAAAADITFGGQLRPRFEVLEQNDFDDTTDAAVLISTRIRLNVNAKINDKTSAFIQMQARGVYGAGTAAAAGAAGGGVPVPLNAGGVGTRSSAVPSDAVTDVGLHQAYFILNDFFGAPVDLKFGRQEIVLDGHRLFGNTGWTQGAQSHDAIRLDHHHGEHTISYMFIKGQESIGGATPSGNPTRLAANVGGAPIAQAGLGGLFGLGSCAGGLGGAGVASPDDNCDRNEHVIHGNLKGILGGALSLYFVATDDNTFNGPGTGSVALVNNTPGAELDNNIYTLGLRQAGQLYGIDYRVEGYYQFGEAEGIASVASRGLFGGAAAAAVAPLTATAPGAGNPLAAAIAGSTFGGGTGSGTDRGAYMFGVRVGKTFNNVMWKPSFTLWYDHLSGTDLGDVASNDWSTFDTLYDTGHKFYGYMDMYLNPTGTDTAWMGLQDLAAKMSIKPMANLTLKADIHAMWTETDLEDEFNDLGIGSGTVLVAAAAPSGVAGGASGTSLTTVGDLDSHLGEELDLTAVYKYNPNTTISVGYSHFWADDTFTLVNQRNNVAGNLGNVNSGNANWAYIQFDVKF